MKIDCEKLTNIIDSELQEIDTLYNCISSAVFIGEIVSKNGNPYVVRIEVITLESAETYHDFTMVNPANNCIIDN